MADEETFAMIKPDVANDEETVAQILECISENGLRVLRKEYVRLTVAQAEENYREAT